MKRTVTILLMDQNRYFTEGLRQGIRHYFDSKKIETIFTENKAHKHTADVIFLAVEPRQNLQLHYLLQFAHPSSKCLLLITEPHQILSPHSPLLKQCRRIISRDSSMDNAIHQLELALQESYVTEAPHKQAILSGREFDIILYLSFGVSNKTIGQLMNISEKTVSSHKRSAMRKLHLRRDIELNYWLLHGGLYSIHRGHNIRDIKCPTPTANTPHVLSQTA